MIDKKIKIAFFGTGEFSRDILDGLYESGIFDVALIVSQGDKPVGRKREIFPTPVKAFAIEKDIEITQPKSLKIKEDSVGEKLVEKLERLNLDFIVVVAYGKIMPMKILDVPKCGSINLHGSILPLYRGASPIQASIKAGDKKTGLTTMYMSAGMDEGDILKIEEIDIEKNDKTSDIFNKFSEIGPSLLIQTLQEIVSGDLEGIKQTDLDATYCGKISKKDGEVSFQKESIKEIYDTFRAYSPWPGIYTYYKRKRLVLEEITLFSDEEFEFKGKVGDFLKISKNRYGIVCKENEILEIHRVKLEGKKSMDIQSFVNGNRDMLGYNFK